MGWVYVLGCEGWPEFYKIGRTNDLDQRIFTLKIQLPTAIKVYCTIPTNQDRFLERYFHEIYEDYRTNGEWFSLNIDSVYFLHHMAKEFYTLTDKRHYEQWKKFWSELPDSMNGSLELSRRMSVQEV